MDERAGVNMPQIPGYGRTGNLAHFQGDLMSLQRLHAQLAIFIKIRSSNTQHKLHFPPSLSVRVYLPTSRELTSR